MIDLEDFVSFFKEEQEKETQCRNEQMKENSDFNDEELTNYKLSNNPLYVAALIENKMHELNCNSITERCSEIVDDLRNYPYFADDDDTKYCFEYNNLKCEVKRNDSWCWLGYVYYNYKGDSSDLIVHGGITYHETEKIGFDCCHAGDLLLKFQSPFSKHTMKDKYRNYEYVVNEVIKLADQLV